MNIPRFTKNSLEDDDFWQGHLAIQSNTKLSQLAYCRENQLDYGRFRYWLKRNKNPIVQKPLIAVKLMTSSVKSAQSPPLCTLVLNTGMQLHIHDAHALMLVLDKVS